MNASSVASHSFLLSEEEGRVWVAGYNDYGQSGTGFSGQTKNEWMLSGQMSVVEVAAGRSHSLVLKQDGRVFGVGRNDSGQLGDGTGEHREAWVPVLEQVRHIAAGFNHSESSDAVGWKRHNGLRHVEDMALGAYHALALDAQGAVWATGSNYQGQLGDGSFVGKRTWVNVLNDVRQIAAGYNYSLAIKQDGTAVWTGGNQFGQQGNGLLIGKNRWTPVDFRVF